jgi:hypothetical protein
VLVAALSLEFVWSRARGTNAIFRREQPSGRPHAASTVAAVGDGCDWPAGAARLREHPRPGRRCVQAAGHAGWLARLRERVDPVYQECR